MKIIHSIGRVSDLIVAKLFNGKTVSSGSLSELTAKLGDLAKHWNYNPEQAAEELSNLFKRARNESLIWKYTSNEDGSKFEYFENFRGIGS